MAEKTIKAEQGEGKAGFTYLNRDCGTVCLSDLSAALDETENLALGIHLLCDTRLENPATLTVEEASELAFIRAGVSGILAKLMFAIPDCDQRF